LGWSFAEVAVGVSQGYEQITLYRDVLVPLGMDDEFLQDWLDGNRRKIYASEEQTQLVQNGSRGGNVAPERELDQQACAENSIGLQVDRDLDHLMALKGREEVEAVYGIPVIVCTRTLKTFLCRVQFILFQRIPVFVSCLQRLDSIILSLGLTLLLSAAYLPTPISIPAWHRPQSSVIPITSSNRLFYATYSVIVTLHLFLSFLHTPLVLPKIGVHTAAYAGLLVGLGCFFAGLGMWDALS
jgi:hypothetical protein